MKTFKVRVTQWVDVTLDETKFTPDFFAEYIQHFSYKDTIEEHAEHLAWLHAAGREDLDTSLPTFIEGYGEKADFGIKATTVDTETEIE